MHFADPREEWATKEDDEDGNASYDNHEITTNYSLSLSPMDDSAS